MLVERQEGERVASDQPSLSVMFATTRGWPDARLPIDASRDQVASVGGEIVVIDGSGRPAPTTADVGPDVKWISRPGRVRLPDEAGRVRGVPRGDRRGD